MRVFSDLLMNVSVLDEQGDFGVFVTDIVFDSREVTEGSVFVAIDGTQVDGHFYINKAVSKGAFVIVCEQFPAELEEGVAYCKVEDSAKALGVIASNFYENPSQSIQLVGVTGTNGKTTCVTLLYQLFKALGYKTGMISTIENRVDEAVVASTHTTPNPVELNKLLAEMVEIGCAYCFMEVSSHAVVQHRIAGLTFSGGLFTNITHDHLDYHGTFKEYIAAKKGFFDGLGKDAFALTNADDKRGDVMLQNTNARKSAFSVRSLGDYSARILESSFDGLYMKIDEYEFQSRMIGTFNASNLLAVYGVACQLGVPALEVLEKLSGIDGAPGRFECFKSPEQVTAIVDYAHTPDALKNVLQTIAKVRTGNEQVITVVGCGGNRDKDKRPVMARVACELSDKVILTSDNPRYEDAGQIINDMRTGVLPPLSKKILAISDRREAIRTACTLASSFDIVLVAGKGHEKYQEKNGVKTPFDDKVVLAEAFNELINQ